MVVIGSGPSGVDIAREVASVASTVYLSSRSCTVEQELTPVRASADLASPLLHLGTLTKVTSATACVSAHGTAVEADAIIMCTGYNYSFPFIDQSMLKVGTLLVCHVFVPVSHCVTYIFVCCRWMTTSCLHCISRCFMLLRRH